VQSKVAAARIAQQQATTRAAKTCKAQRAADPAAFRTAYGTGANAFGKCVAKLAKSQNG
jgi:hypothetical protein